MPAWMPGTLLEVAGLTLVGLLLLNGLAHLLRGSWRWRREAQLLRQEAAALEASLVRHEAIQNLVIEAGQAWHGVRKFEVAKKRSEGDEMTCSLYLRPHDRKPVAGFQPGQFLVFHLRPRGSSKVIKRCYSLSDRFHADHYRISVKKVLPLEEHPASNYLVSEVKQGDILDAEAPRGKFFLELTEQQPVVMIAGGIGITPLLSMIHSLHATGGRRPLWLFFCIRNRRDYLFRDELERMAGESPHFHLHVCYSREKKPQDVMGSSEQVRNTLLQSMSISTKPRFVLSESGDEYELKGPELTIGRAPECDIPISYPTVSSRHARLRNKRGRWHIEDLGSLNGTTVEGKSLAANKPRPLTGNERIRLADAVDALFVAEGEGGGGAVDGSQASPTVAHYQRFTFDLLNKTLPSLNFLYYMCGPTAMMHDIRDQLQVAGVPGDRIHFEAFTPASRTTKKAADLAATRAGTLTVRFERSDLEVAWDGNANNLLELAEQHQIPIAAGCRVGNCGECKTAIRGGEVEYVGECDGCDPGSCLTCVAVPKGDVVLDA